MPRGSDKQTEFVSHEVEEVEKYGSGTPTYPRLHLQIFKLSFHVCKQDHFDQSSHLGPTLTTRDKRPASKSVDSNRLFSSHYLLRQITLPLQCLNHETRGTEQNVLSTIACHWTTMAYPDALELFSLDDTACGYPSMDLRPACAQRDRQPRKGHKKSRRGCYECKRRKIKVRPAAFQMFLYCLAAILTNP